MLKKLAAVLFMLVAFCGSSYATSINDYPFDRYNLYNLNTTNNDYANYLYGLYGDAVDFNYQLRDLAGRTTAGNQWFATIYENYYYTMYNTGNNTGNRVVYRRTTGGEIPEIPISAIGNLIGGFNFMTLEEQQPYPAWVNVYDSYPDPIESVCLVIKNGTADFNVRFGNPYASHYPYWWHWTTPANSAWWNDRNNVQSINEPIAYVVDTSNNNVWRRGDDGYYTEAYTYVLSSDTEGGSTHYEVLDTNGRISYITSGDVIYKVSNDVIRSSDVDGRYQIRNSNIYNLNSSELAYTIENETNSLMYICEVRKVSESIRLEGFDDTYRIMVNPTVEGRVNPGDYFDANVRLYSTYGSTYGSTLGYLTFRQRADLLRGYTRYQEFTTIPMVIANVVDGNAADEPLQFDMTVYDSATDKSAAHVVSRVKFEWDAQEDMPNQDLGTFFMMQSRDSGMPVYYLETRITNNTGTRYELFRYDMEGRTTGYRNILPQYWKYNLIANPGDNGRETLPDHFHLNANSQIAPGLVTVYDHSVYGTINTAYDTYESFQVNEYNSSNPKGLRLNYRRVRGMYPAENRRRQLPDGSAGVQGFRMEFTDIAQDANNTRNQLAGIMGKPPAMISSAASLVSPDGKYIRSQAWNSFTLSKDVPFDQLDVISVFDPSDPQPVSNDPSPGTGSRDVEASYAIRASGYYSPDIAPLLPVSIRLVIPGQNSLLRSRWEELNNATTSERLLDIFRTSATVWVRSLDTREVDLDLFKNLDEQDNGTSTAECVHAFIYDNSVYLDFIVVLADSVSTNTRGNKTAFLKVFRDDDRPYILLGDGRVDGRWNLTFYVASPEDRYEPIPASPDIRPQTDNDDGGGGGGCNSGIYGVILLGVMFLKRR